MESISSRPLRVAILDMNNNHPNLGLNCIRTMVKLQSGEIENVLLDYDIFDVRAKDEVPDLSYDIYISSGGPGSPYDGEGMDWEEKYFEWLHDVWAYNLDHEPEARKHVFLICHSFQMAVRYFKLAQVVPRKGESFGIFSCSMTESGKSELIFEGLTDPFYIADFRKLQVIQPNLERISGMGAEILCIEQDRPHVPLERAIMGIRITPEIIGVQFHPEADPPGMAWRFIQPERQQAIKENFGEEKYQRIMRHLYDPNYLFKTYNTVLPNFLKNAILSLRPQMLVEA